MLKSLVGALVAGEMKKLARRTRNAVLLNVLAGVSAIAGVGFLVGAGFTAAARRYGSVETAIGFAAGFIAIAALLIAINALQAKAWKRRRLKAEGSELRALAATAAIAALPGLLKSKTGLAGVLLPIAALVALKIYDENRSDGDSGED